MRVKEGYSTLTSVAQTGKHGYMRSIAMAARNVEECKQRGRHRAEQRQEHANAGGSFTAQRDRGFPAAAPGPELKMDGIGAESMTHKWFSCTVATPGRHMPTSFYTVLRRWILTTVAILIEIGEDKYGFTASARRNGAGRVRGRGRGGGRGGRGRIGAYDLRWSG